MPVWFVPLFVAVDVVLTLAVLYWMFRRRGGLAAITGTDLARVAALAHEMTDEAEAHLRANWSGDPATLREPLSALLDRFDARVRDAGIAVDRERLKHLLVSVVAAKRLAHPADAEAALREAA